ncbi:hypothetical protein [Pedobacter nutrimenti]|uniref:hypothetical protein n=1 Tax=Pedobacter nutrimenti TaxID=1241337 RepID=UPI003744797D
MPCCALEKNDVQHQQQKPDKHSEKAEDCCKCCSPFYVCGTCIGFTINSFSLLSFALILKPVQHDSIYLPVELSQIPQVIWQPPKLS